MYNRERSRAIFRGQQLHSFYSGLSREKLINELIETENIVSSNRTPSELKNLYKRRYMTILEILKEKLEKSQLTDFNERVS